MATRAQAVALARTYVGCSRGDKQHRDLVNTFNSVKPHGEVGNYSCAWCAITWTALMIKLKMGQDKAAYSYNCGTLITYSRKIGTWVENDAYVPLPGDGIIYYWGDSGRGDCTSGASHVGMVEEVSGGYITIIEGNKGSGYCGRRKIKVNSRYIRGYMVPKYEGSSNMETAKLDVDGWWGTMTTLVSQQILGTYADGVVSDQATSDKVYCKQCQSDSWQWVRNPKNGSSLVKAIQSLVKMDTAKQDGFMGPATIRALQKFLNIPVTGVIDVHTVRSWQLYLNKKIEEKNKKKSTPSVTPAKTKLPVPTMTEVRAASNAAIRYDIVQQGIKIANDNSFHYVYYSDDPLTHTCPICNPSTHKDYDHHGGNCIWFVIQTWKHGGKINCRCNCEGINNQTGERMMRSTHAEALRIAKEKLGVNEIELISNSGNAVSTSKIKPGDIILLITNDGEYYHMILSQGGDVYADNSSGRSDNIKHSQKMDSYTKKNVKIVIHYTGTRDYLSRGAEGVAVRKVQAIVGTVVDGSYGPNTVAAVNKWKKAHGLPQNGKVDATTLNKMKEVA